MNPRAKSNTSKNSHWISFARSVALVSGIFAVIVAALLLINFLLMQMGLPENEVVYSQKIVDLKSDLANNPANQQLIEEIRRLDLELRQTYFNRMAFARRGRVLLLIGVAICLLALQLAASLQKSPRKPRHPLEPAVEVLNQRQGFKAVSFLGLSLAGIVLALALVPGVELQLVSATSPVTETPVAVLPDYPSREDLLQNWHIFRGPDGTGIAYSQNIPASWDGESGEGILWKANIPLPGNNSPIVWGERVFLCGASETNKEVFCYSTATGELQWRKSVNVPAADSGEIDIFEENGLSSPTMACDGSRVYVIFSDGSLACFDFNGKEVWSKHLGIPDNIYGHASSLTMYRNLLLIQYDQGMVGDDISVLYALEGKTGEIVWQVKRPVANAWTTPIIIDTGTEEQLITCSEPWVIAYNPATGEELWKADLMGTDLAPSPIYANGLVIVTQPNQTIYALRTDGRGDVTDSHVAWMSDCYAPDICSPVSNGELIFLLGTTGVLTCLDSQTGEVVYEEEIDDTFMASPTLAGEWLYLIGEEGTMHRIKAAREFEEGERSHLSDHVKASPAFLDGRIYIRGESTLYCVGNQ
ncbi:MAG: PQQ-binding-like beta-propeller repeat protein [bacterium]|jgi:outer membrane protein assembly factor BamB